MDENDDGWRISSYSSGGSCVEVRGGPAVRDSKDPGGPVLRFPPGVWKAFTAAVKAS